MSDRALVLYGTTDGQTRKIAEAIGRTLRSQGLEATVADARSADSTVRPDDYAVVFVAASVHASGYQRPVIRWVRSHADALGARPTAFVSVCLGVLQHEPAVDQALAGILRRFLDSTGWEPTRTKIVAGALPYTKYWWLKRLMMRRIVAKAKGDTDTSRDYEYTDWGDLAWFVETFVREHLFGTSGR
jgi:menaquinone-dependent protoporphyrinogen oxidase